MADGVIRRVIEIDAKVSASFLNEIRQAQAATKALEDAARGTTLGIKQLVEGFNFGGTASERFVRNVKDQGTAFAGNKRQMDEYKAAMLGVFNQTFALTQATNDEAAALEHKQAVEKQGVAIENAIAAAEGTRYDRGPAIVANLIAQRDAIGKTREELSRLAAVSANVGELYDKLTAQVRSGTQADALRLDTLREVARAEDEVAAADRRHSEAGQTLLGTLREQNRVLLDRVNVNRTTLGGSTNDIAIAQQAPVVRQAAASGVSGQASDELRYQRDLQRELSLTSDLMREQARADDEAAAADRRHSEAGQALLVSLRERITAQRELIARNGAPVNELDQVQTKANESGVGAQAAELIATFRAQADAEALAHDRYAELIRVEDEAAAADKRHSDAGQGLLVTLREQNRALLDRIEINRTAIAGTPDEVAAVKQAPIQRQAAATGVSSQASDELRYQRELQTELEHTSAVLREQESAKAESAAAAARFIENTERTVAALQREIDVLGKDRLAIVEYDAAIAGNTAQVKPLVDLLRDKIARQNEDAASLAKTAAAEKEATAAIASLKSQQDAYVKALQDKVNTQNLDARGIERYRAAQLGVTAQTDDLIDKLKKSTGAAHGLGQGLGVSSGVGRELIVLTHEMSQGQFTRFGGSLLVLAELTNFSSFAFSGLGAAVLAIVGVTVGFFALLAKGAFEQHKFNDELKLTGNYAGVTEDSFRTLASTVASTSGVTVGSARGITEALVATGRVGPGALQSVAVAAADLSRLTHKSAEDVAKEFQDITKNVVDWAQKSNEQYHFLDFAMFQHIKNLQEQGKEEEAAVFAADALHKALAKQAEDLGTVAKVWLELKNAISGTIAAIEDYGKKDTPATIAKASEERIAALQRQREQASIKLTAPDSGIEFDITPNLNKIDDEIAQQREIERHAQDTLREQTATAKARAEFAEIQAKGISASNTFASIEHGLGLGNRALEESQKYKKAIEEIRSANAASATPLPESSNRAEITAGKAIASEKIVQEDLAAIREKYGNKAGRAEESAFTQRLRSLREEDAGLREQIKAYQDLDYAAAHAARSKLEAAFDTKGRGNALANIPESQKNTLRAEADRIDADAAQLRAEKDLNNMQKGLALIKAEADAQSSNTREAQYAAVVGKVSLDLQNTGNAELIAKRDKLLASYKEEINLRADNELRRGIRARAGEIDEEVKKLDTENTLLGLNSIERAKVLAALKFEAEARKQLIANPNNGEEINAARIANTDALTAALQRNYDAQRQFEVGAKTAFQAYSDDAENAAQFSQDIISHSLGNLTNSLATFYATGKFSLSKFLADIAADLSTQFAKMQIKSLLDEDSVRTNINSVLDFLKQAFFGQGLNKPILNVAGPASTAGGGFVTPGASANAISAASVPLAQDLGGYVTPGASAGVTNIVNGQAQTTAITAATTGFTELVAQGITPTDIALTALADEGILPTNVALASMVDEGVIPSAAGLLSLNEEGVVPATLGLLEFTEGGLQTATAGLFEFVTALQLAAETAGASSAADSGSGLGSIIDLFAGAAATAANGGLMTPFGMLPLQTYSTGGIANRPKLAIYGEGRVPEAYVPLPDGRTIPVTIKEENGKQRAYVPLPDGRFIPATVTGLESTTESTTFNQYAQGGIDREKFFDSQKTSIFTNVSTSTSDRSRNSSSSSTLGRAGSYGSGGGGLSVYAIGGVANTPLVQLVAEAARAGLPGFAGAPGAAGQAGLPGLAGAPGAAGKGGTTLAQFAALGGAPAARAEAPAARVEGSIASQAPAVASKAGFTPMPGVSGIDLGGLAALFAKGGISSHTFSEMLRDRKETIKFATGGIMTPFGRLVPEAYSAGGITNTPKLALFGEGRRPEAYIPLEDGKTIPVTVQMSNGQRSAFVRLPSGQSIPVTLKTDSFMAAGPSAAKQSSSSTFAQGGIAYHDRYIRAYADGGIAGGTGSAGFDSSMQLTRPLTMNGETNAAGNPRGAGQTHITIENNGPAIKGERVEKESPNGDKEIRFIVDAAVAEVDRRIVGGGSTHAALKRQGVAMNGLNRRG